MGRARYVLTPTFPTGGSLLALLRGRVGWVVTGVLLLVWAYISALLLTTAYEQQRTIEDRAISLAIEISRHLDQEVGSGIALLKGLSTSPALEQGDLEAFYAQLKATPIEAGCWLALWDTRRQILNTLRPFGDVSLPTISDYRHSDEALGRLRERDVEITGAVMTRVAKIRAFGVNLRLQDRAGRATGILTLAFPETALAASINRLAVPPGWAIAVFDRRLISMMRVREGHVTDGELVGSDLGIPADGAFVEKPSQGLVEARLTDGSHGVVAAFRRSDITSWTTAVSLPLGLLETPVSAALARIALVGLLVLAFGIVAVWLITQALELPLRRYEAAILAAQAENQHLSERLIHLQAEERGHIARELHDSTAQHVVAASLNLVTLARGARADARVAIQYRDVMASLDAALKELRSFAYLLNPPVSAEQSLADALRDFVDGYARRTGIAASLAASHEIDAAAVAVRTSVFRIVQEALMNVHRHALANRVRIRVAVRSDRLVTIVHDDGVGLPARVAAAVNGSEERDKPGQLGIGLKGMQTRLQHLGGSMRIRTSATGTTILALVPLAGRTSRAAA